MAQEKNLPTIQERLCALEASQSIISTFLVAVCETHQDKEVLRKQFSMRSEILISKSLTSGAEKEYIDTVVLYRDAFLHAFDHTEQASG